MSSLPAILFRTGALLMSGGITAGALGNHAFKDILGEKLPGWLQSSAYMMMNGGSRRSGPS
jgi:hypothetical protein